VDLIGDPGGLLRREVQTHTPCGKPSDHCENIHFQFNATLLRDDYQLPPDMAATVLEHTEELRSDVASYLDTVRLTPTFFPDILKRQRCLSCDCSPGSRACRCRRNR